MKKIFHFFIFLFAVNLQSEQKQHEIWWEKALGQDTPFSTFTGWLGDEDALSRKAMRRDVVEKNYHSILDIPCGCCTDYYGLKKDGIDIEYLGIDVTPKLVAIASQNQIPVALGSIESIPLADSSFDIVYARHILEHLDDYKLAISELVRVAKKEVFIIFFISPNETDQDWINLATIDNYPVYHNNYSKSKFEEHLLGYEKIKRWNWEKISDQEVILHIYFS